MGMFDKPQYLTGDNGFAEPGDTFWLHNARLDGFIKVRGEERENVKLLVSRTRDEKPVIVFSSGRGISGQVKRMSAEDRQSFPIEVRLDAIPTGQGNPAHVLNPINTPPPNTSDSDDDEAIF